MLVGLARRNVFEVVFRVMVLSASCLHLRSLCCAPIVERGDSVDVFFAPVVACCSHAYVRPRVCSFVEDVSAEERWRCFLSREVIMACTWCLGVVFCLFFSCVSANKCYTEVTSSLTCMCTKYVSVACWVDFCFVLLTKTWYCFLRHRRQSTRRRPPAPVGAPAQTLLCFLVLVDHLPDAACSWTKLTYQVPLWTGTRGPSGR